MKRNRGFTFVEMVLVIIMIIMFSVIVFPSVIAVQRSQAASGFRIGLENVAQIARRQAVLQNRATVLKFGSDNQIGWDYVEEPTETDTQSENRTVQEEDSLELGQVRNGISTVENTEFTKFRRNKLDESQSEWQVGFFPDGTADRAVAEFTQDGRSYLLIISPLNGASSVVEGTLDDYEGEGWEAGEIERRVG